MIVGFVVVVVVLALFVGGRGEGGVAGEVVALADVVRGLQGVGMTS
jgi:hypothetical protein